MKFSVMYRLLVLLAAVGAACGRNVDNRVIGGKPATIEEYPHQVSLRNKPGGFYCGGSFVSTQHVLTAGHCALWKDPKKVVVHAGSSFRVSGGEVLDVQSLTPHQNFSIQYMDYDVAIIKLFKPIVKRASVAPISLVPVNNRRYYGEMLTATGWGMTKYVNDDSQPASVLQAIRIAVADSRLCETAHARGSYRVTQRMFCAGGKMDQGTYLGDSGGPIINDKKQLVGVVSWGHIGNITGYPGVYVDLTVAEIRNFVEKTIK